MKYTKDQMKAISKIKQGSNILLTGKPGTGKTELLRNICKEFQANGKKVVATGTTGMAASNLENGRTLHSFLRWSPGRKEYDYSYCAENLSTTDVLIVDEISMLGPSISYHLVKCLNAVEKKPQIIMSGDFFQLPPVNKGRERIYPFEYPSWPYFDLEPCILNEVVRQKDSAFLEMLEKAMMSDKSCIVYFVTEAVQDEIKDAIVLCTRNDFADSTNKERYDALPGEGNLYPAQGDVEQANFKCTRIKYTLKVKEKMRVMSLKNDQAGRYQNGSLGTVVGMGKDCIRVAFDNGNEVNIYRETYNIDNKKSGGDTIKIMQFPLAGGYAITIHKSQGQTFDAVNIQAPNCWEPGQLYVALSRARSIKGMHFMAPITENCLMTDPRVIDFYTNITAAG